MRAWLRAKRPMMGGGGAHPYIWLVCPAQWCWLWFVAGLFFLKKLQALSLLAWSQGWDRAGQRHRAYSTCKT